MLIFKLLKYFSMQIEKNRNEIFRWLTATDSFIDQEIARNRCESNIDIWFTHSHEYLKWKRTLDSFLWMHDILDSEKKNLWWAFCSVLGLRSWAHIDAQHCQQPENSVQKLKQNEKNRRHVLASIDRIRKNLKFWTHIDAEDSQQLRSQIKYFRVFSMVKNL